MSSLNRAIAIAARAHEDQVDKAGDPYILHPLRVMLAVESEDERITAVLHDVVEDSTVSLADLRAEGFSETVITAIDAVTRRPEESYGSFIDRASSNAIGRRVKLADLFDNSELGRIATPGENDYARIEKYQAAIRQVLGGYLLEDHLEGIPAEAVFSCALCGEVAGRITLIRTSKGVLLQRDSFTSMMGGGGYLKPKKLEELLPAVLRKDPAQLFQIDLELTPFYCADCETVYCGAHWFWWTVFDEDAPSFSDYINGRCPEGHTRMLED